MVVMSSGFAQWLRRSFLTGFFHTVPLVISVVALVWVFRFADSLTSGLSARLLGQHVPGLGLLTTVLFVLAVGAIAGNVFGQRVLSRGDQLLLHIPLFRTIYAPVKQLITAFSPDNELGFKRVVLVEQAPRGFALGFLTRELSADRGHGPETLLAVYVPTNHLYLGDVVLVRPDQVTYPDLTVEEGLRVFLTGGMGLPEDLRFRPGARE
jgi:uncharacterized membrane protein